MNLSKYKLQKHETCMIKLKSYRNELDLLAILYAFILAENAAISCVLLLIVLAMKTNNLHRVEYILHSTSKVECRVFYMMHLNCASDTFIFQLSI